MREFTPDPSEPSSVAGRAGHVRRWTLRLAPLALLLLALALVLTLGGQRWLTIDALAGRLQALSVLVADHPWWAAGALVAVSAGTAALSLPAATVLSLAAGYAFGAPFGAVLSVSGATLGGVVAFLALRQAGVGGLAARLPVWLRPLMGKMAGRPWAVIIILRLLPVLPFSAINVLAVAIRMPLGIFAAGTALGAYPPQFLYALLGARLPTLLAQGVRPGAGLLLRPDVGLPLAALVLLAAAPVLARYWRRTP
ncbi:MAG: VTT domain-containing protein [Azospirillaceae bacterium]|nr:VTT domain-containing protein [Azospirillaceae bacterium]